MELTFQKISFRDRLKSMLKVDLRRFFTTPLFYIMVGVCFLIPVLVLVMTSMMPSTTIDPVTGEEKVIETFTNVWQTLGTTSDSSMATTMDLTSMCNINMLYFLIPVFLCIFIGDDFRSGYAKNIFTVRAKKTDYVISKTTIGFIGSIVMLLAYFIGALLGGRIAGLSFELVNTTALGIAMCFISKIFITLIFVALSVLMSVVAKQKLWLSIICSLASCMLLYTMIPMIAPLDSTIINLIMSLSGGVLFAVGIGWGSNLVLNKTNIV